MQYDKNDELLVAAFSVIEKYDPDTYNCMVAEGWNVSTFIDEAFPKYWTMAAADESTITSFGATLSDSDGLDVPQPQTWINTAIIDAVSTQAEVDRAKFTAITLVHEFAHRHHGKPGFNGDEIDAGKVGLKFTRLIGGHDGQFLTWLSEKILEENS